MRVLHLSPHPDDEALGAPVTLMTLAEEGYKVDNLTLSFGSLGQEDKRREEVALACQRLSLHSLFPESQPRINGIRSKADFIRGKEDLILLLQEIIGDYDLVISPSHIDLHPAHEVVGHAVRQILPEGMPWWQWALWGDLPFPNLLYPFGEERMKRAKEALAAHQSQLTRNDYQSLLLARARMMATLAPEKVFSFGDGGFSELYAEVLSIWRQKGGRWFLEKERISGDPSFPLFQKEEEKRVEDLQEVQKEGRDLTFFLEDNSARYKALPLK